MKNIKNYSTLNECPISSDNNPINYFSLGEVPIVNNLSSTLQESLEVDKYPLNLIYFEKSGLSCLDCIVNPKLLFSNYLYKSSVNIPYLEHCKEMFYSISDYIEFKNLNICDIGGNDGSLLNIFKSLANNDSNYYLNIDPSENLTKVCREKKIDTLCDFFSLETSNKINKKFDIILSTNVFQHLQDINSFLLGINQILKKDGIWILEFPYWFHDMETNQFDQIYHEHIYYYSITPLKFLLENNSLKILNISKQKIHGGTLRLYISKVDSKFYSDESIDKYIESEKKYDLQYHLEWGKNIISHINNSKEFLLKLKSEGNKIFGFGAAAKGCIYLNSMNVNKDIVDVIIDDTDLKQNKFIPGLGIQVKSREFLKENKPDYILILAHNFSDYIIESLKDIYNGNFILLLPEIKII